MRYSTKRWIFFLFWEFISSTLQKSVGGCIFSVLLLNLAFVCAFSYAATPWSSTRASGQIQLTHKKEHSQENEHMINETKQIHRDRINNAQTLMRYWRVLLMQQSRTDTQSEISWIKAFPYWHTSHETPAQLQCHTFTFWVMEWCIRVYLKLIHFSLWACGMIWQHL